MAPWRWTRLVQAAILSIVGLTTNAMALDLDTLWDFRDPALSEQRFEAALVNASPDEKLILHTQIARTFGLRGEFNRAREILAAIETSQATASPEAQVRYHLELGRTYASATHPESDRTPASDELARRNFMKAFEIAERAQLDSLAIDALHMMPFVDTEPAQQLGWNERALAYLERSSQPDAKRWEGPLRNNVGYARRLAGDYEAALHQFRLSRAAYERAGRAANVRIADWMIARTLRDQSKYQDALAIQLRLEREWDAAGEPDPYVYEELVYLYRALGNEDRAKHYAALQQRGGEEK